MKRCMLDTPSRNIKQKQSSGWSTPGAPSSTLGSWREEAAYEECDNQIAERHPDDDPPGDMDGCISQISDSSSQKSNVSNECPDSVVSVRAKGGTLKSILEAQGVSAEIRSGRVWST